MFDPTATRKDVMYGFAVEEELSEELLRQYQQAYPQWADDLLTLYHELLQPESEEDDRDPTPEDLAVAEAAWKRHAAALEARNA
jgi:hypothetical protein